MPQKVLRPVITGLSGALSFLDGVVKRLNFAGLILASIFLVVVVLVGAADVVGTNLFHLPVPSALEVSENAMVFMTIGGLAYAVQRQSHVGVDLFVGKFSAWVKVLATALTLAVSLAVFAFLSWRAGVLAIDSFELNEFSSGLLRFPVYPAKVALSAGCGLAALESLRQLVRLCMGRPAQPDDANGSEQIV